MRLARLVHAQQPLARTARQAHKIALIAQVIAHLACDGRYGEGGEFQALARVVALDRVQKRERRDLRQILRLDAAPGEAPRDGLRQIQIRFGDGVTVLYGRRLQIGLPERVFIDHCRLPPGKKGAGAA